MFANKYRLRDTKRIAEVFKTGRYIHGKYVFIKYVPSKQVCARIAISVSTKLFKQATKRNRIKRLIREALKPHLSNLPELDILVITKSTLTTDVSLDALKKDTDEIFKKLTSPKY